MRTKERRFAPNAASCLSGMFCTLGRVVTDVFDTEPLPASHPFRTLDNVLATPHIGYVSHGLYKTFYEDTVSNIRRWLDTH